MGGSPLGSPSCSTDGKGQRHGEPQARMRQRTRKGLGRDETADGKHEGKQLSQSLRAVSTDPLTMAITMSFALRLES